MLLLLLLLSPPPLSEGEEEEEEEEGRVPWIRGAAPLPDTRASAHGSLNNDLVLERDDRPFEGLGADPALQPRRVQPTLLCLCLTFYTGQG